MSSRAVPFITGEIYHIYNRGCEKRCIFENYRNYNRFLRSIIYYQYADPKPRFSTFVTAQPSIKTDKNIEIIAYCLMPNHYHFLVKQLSDNAISNMFSRLGNSYTKYFNNGINRVGPLFQGEFKAVLIKTDEQLVHVSRYIHLNPVASLLVKRPEDWEWSSYKEYVSDLQLEVCSKNLILELIGSKEEYQKFVEDQIEYAKSLELIKHQLLD